MGREIYCMKTLCPLILDYYTSLQVKAIVLSHHKPTISVTPQWSSLVVFEQTNHMCWSIYLNHDKITKLINTTNKAK
jgi:hypothetical protein